MVRVEREDPSETGLRQIHELEILPPDRWLEQFRRYKESSSPEEKQHLRETLVRAHLRFVVRQAGILQKRDQRARSFSIADLVNEGVLGALAALERYDPQTGYTFTTYAERPILWAMKRALSLAPLIRKPTHLERKRRNISLALEYARNREGRPHAIAAALLGIPEEKIRGILYAFNAPSSLDHSLGERTPHNFLPSTADPERDAFYREKQRVVGKVLESLDARTSQMVALHYGLVDGKPQPYAEIGARYGISRQRAEQIISRVLPKLRENPSLAALL